MADTPFMALHPLLTEKLNVALARAQPLEATRRDARLSGVPGKVHAVIGIRGENRLHDACCSAKPPDCAILEQEVERSE